MCTIIQVISSQRVNTAGADMNMNKFISLTSAEFGEHKCWNQI